MAEKTKILVVDDDEHIAELISLYLAREGYDTKEAYSGPSAVETFESYQPSLILLDIMLPGMDGMDVCKAIRKKKDIPILMVSAKKEDLDKITGLGYGADDYIVKPFSPKELVARVIAHISRYERLTAKNENSDAKTIETDGLKLDGRARRAFVNGKELTLTNKEFDLLYFLASSPDTVYSKEELFSKIWNYDSIGETSTITVHVNRIRDKIKEVDPSMDFIHTVWGKGYRFNK